MATATVRLGLDKGDWRVIGVHEVHPIARVGAAAAPAALGGSTERGVRIAFRDDRGSRSDADAFVGVGSLLLFPLRSRWSVCGGHAKAIASSAPRPGDRRVTVRPRFEGAMLSIRTDAWGADAPPAGAVAGMAFWETSDEDGPLLIPVPELVRAALMPSSAFAQFLLEDAKGREAARSTFTRSGSGPKNHGEIVVWADRRLSPSEAVVAAALIRFDEPNAFLRHCRRVTRHELAADPWSDAPWPLPADAGIEGIVRACSFHDGETVRAVRVLAVIDRCLWPSSLAHVVVEHPIPAETAQGVSRGAPASSGPLVPACAAEPGRRSEFASCSNEAAAGLTVGYRPIRLRERPRGAAVGHPDARAHTTATFDQDGSGRRAEFSRVGASSDAAHGRDMPERLRVTLAALRLMAANAAANTARIADWELPELRRWHRRPNSWTELGGRGRLVLFADVRIGRDRLIVVDCETACDEALAISVLRLSGDVSFASAVDDLAPLVSRARGQVEGCALKSLDFAVREVARVPHCRSADAPALARVLASRLRDAWEQGTGSVAQGAVSRSARPSGWFP